MSTRTRTMSRSTDPATSREAAKRQVRSGRARSHREAILHALQRNGGMLTAVELHGLLPERLRIGRHEVSRRLPELEEAGLVERCLPRVCRVNERRMVTWCAVRGGAR